MPPDTSASDAPEITNRIRILRGERVLIDADLAALYGVPTKRLNEQVKRNQERFPADFMFQLTEKEATSLRSQFATLDKSGRGEHRKYRPWAFTEHGAIMAATVLNSSRAVEMTVYVVRAFVKLRHMLASNAEIERELDIVKRSIANLDAETQRQFDQVFEAILGLMAVRPRQ
jgi:phage regulator Rha-like protein